MKKIFILLLTILTVVLSVPVTAAERSFEDILHDEIIQLIDIKQYGADENDEGIYLISVMESGYTEKGFSDQTALYVYLYNPSMKKITSSDLNTISMATEYNEDGKPVDFKKYRLQVEGSTSGGLYIRAKVAASAKTLAHVKDGVRWYGITEIELREDSKYNAAALEVGYVYKFRGYDKTLKCSRSSFLTLTLKVHQVSYLTGSSTKPSNDVWTYSNQLNSVYFSIPKSIEALYGKLYSIQYEYYKVYTNPIIVTDSADLEYRLLDYVENGTSLSDLYMCAYMNSLASEGVDWTLCMHSSIGKGRDFSYVHDKDNPNIMYYKLYDGSVFSGYRNCPVVTDGIYYEPTVVFGVNEIIDGKAFFDAKDLQDAFVTYTEQYGDPSALYWDKYSKDLIYYRDEDLLPSYVVEEKNRDELFDIEDSTSNLPWWQKLLRFGSFGTTAQDVPYIEQVSWIDTQASDFSDTFFVSESDVEDLQKFCKDASVNAENVYLLRYAKADNYAYADLYHENCVDCKGDSSCDSKLYMLQGNAYLNFDIIKLSFGDEPKDLTVFGVVASPTDGFFPGEVWDSGTKEDKDPWAWLKKLVAVALIVVLVGVVIWLIGLFGELGQASTNRQILRELRRRKKK